MSEGPEENTKAIEALREGMEAAWDLLALDDEDPRVASEAMALAAFASLQAAGFSVVRAYTPKK